MRIGTGRISGMSRSRPAFFRIRAVMPAPSQFG
jgi:hypothetical protein